MAKKRVSLRLALWAYILSVRMRTKMPLRILTIALDTTRDYQISVMGLVRLTKK